MSLGICMKSSTYSKIIVTSGEHYFSFFCSDESLEKRHDEIMLWADKLATRLRWQIYDTSICPASEVEATKRPHALFDYRFPKN